TSVVDIAAGTVIAAVKIGDEPEGVKIRPDGKVVYVTSEEDSAVFAIDTATYKVLKKIPVGHRPRGIGFLPDGSRAYVTLENNGALALIDARRHAFMKLVPITGQGRTPKPRPMGIAVHPDGSMIYVTTGSFRQKVLLHPKNNGAGCGVENRGRPPG